MAVANPLFGIDISNNNHPTLNLQEVRNEGYSFLMAKVSQGSTFVDTTWPGYLSQARQAGLLVAGYHYVTSDPPADQAKLFVDNLGSLSLPAMLDFERGAGDITNFWAVLEAIQALGVTVKLSYIPQWYWNEIGSPDISTVPGLVASNWVSGSGYGSVLYPGNSFAGWDGYGGANPVILQFTSSALVDGQKVDADAFQGSQAQLKALFAGSSMGRVAPPSDVLA